MPQDSDKPEYIIPHKWDTLWLGNDASITDIDLAGGGIMGINIYEIKRKSPLLSKLQKILFANHIFHLVIVPSPEKQTSDHKYHFESLTYEIYCPYKRQEFIYAEYRRSWRITSKPQKYLTHDEARAIFRGDAVWPCCGRPTIPR